MPVLPGNLATITTGFLDTVNDVGVMSQVAGDISERRKLGGLYEFNNAQALAHSSVPATQRLYAGYYQYVKAVSTLARGQIGVFDTAANTGWTDFEFTSTISAPLEGFAYGIALGAVTSGRYCFVQVSGLANVLFRGTVTDKTAGNIVLQLTTTNTADAIADSTGSYISGGTKGIKNIIGTAYNAPTDAGVTLVMLKNNCWNLG